MMKKYDTFAAHKFCRNHMPELKEDAICGCFYCMSIFPPSEIGEWIIDENQADIRGTALCPFCGSDSVIGESSGFPIMEEFLAAMKRHWFENNIKL